MHYFPRWNLGRLGKKNTVMQDPKLMGEYTEQLIKKLYTECFSLNSRTNGLASPGLLQPFFLLYMTTKSTDQINKGKVIFPV